MSKNQIYTPGAENPFNAFRIGDKLKVTVKEDGFVCIGRITAFPKNSLSDNDHRMKIKPVRRDWLGEMTISAENNFYGSYHVSEVEIERQD